MDEELDQRKNENKEGKLKSGVKLTDKYIL